MKTRRGGRKKADRNPYFQEDRVVHRQTRINGAEMLVYWVPTPNGLRYATAVKLAHEMYTLTQDNGHIYTTYEEAAGLFTRYIIDDEPEKTGKHQVFLL